MDSHPELLRTTFYAGPPADVTPMRITLNADFRPVRVRLRNYSPYQIEFLKRNIDDLINCGMVFFNTSTTWAFSRLLVPKPGPARFSFTVDLRPVNTFTSLYQYPMPNWEVEHTKTAQSHFLRYSTIRMVLEIYSRL